MAVSLSFLWSHSETETTVEATPSDESLARWVVKVSTVSFSRGQIFKLSLLVLFLLLPNQLISPHRLIAPNLFSLSTTSIFMVHYKLRHSALVTSPLQLISVLIYTASASTLALPLGLDKYR